MQARMKNPVMILPGAMEAIQSLAKAAELGGVPKKTLDLVHLRASQINGCSVCADMDFASSSGTRPKSAFSRWRRGTTLRTSPTPSVPHSPSPKPLPDSATGVIQCPMKSGKRQLATTTSLPWRH